MALPLDLARALVGEWTGTYRLWLQPGVLAEECPTRATFRAELADRFVRGEYDWSFEGAPQQGVVLLGRADDGTYQTAWIDTFHTADGFMWSTGTGPDPTVLTAYGPPGEQWSWRTQFAVDGDDLVITAWNITPQGDEGKATEARYTRSS